MSTTQTYTYLDEEFGSEERRSNYLKIQDGETKTLLFTNDREHSHKFVHPNGWGDRGEFYVEDHTTDPPRSGLILQLSMRWSRAIAKELAKVDEGSRVFIDISRQGSGKSDTVYFIRPSERPPSWS